MTDRAMGEHRQVGGTTTDVDQTNPQFLFIRVQHRSTGSHLLQNDVVHLQTAALHALDDILGGADRAGDDMHPRLQPYPGHPDWILNTFLTVDDELLRQDVQDLLVGWNRHHPRRFHHSIDVFRRGFPVLDGGHAVRIEPANVTTGNAGIDRMNLATRHSFGFVHRVLDRPNGRLDVDDHALLQASRGMRADADHLDGPIQADLADDDHHFRGADIEPDNQILVFFPGHILVLSHNRPSPPSDSMIRSSSARRSH